MVQSSLQQRQATIEDLYRVHGKAELVNGEIVFIAPMGGLPAQASGEVLISLRDYAKRHGVARAIPGSVGYHVHLPNRGSFSPDAAYHLGPRTGMKFLEGAPVFAVEVQSEGDYGPAAERDMPAKRADYFAAGTQVVWDVDLLAEEFVVHVYRAVDPQHPTGYRRGEVAEAEPAVPGWTMPVDALLA